ncbi:hypothetical protein JCM11641_005055 [Rhodosporidiobolus odoratus]
MAAKCESLKALLDRAVARGDAPGLVASAFNRNTITASGASRVADLKTGAPMSEDTTICYGGSPTIVCLFIARKSGTTLRRAVRELVLDPFGIDADLFDSFVTPQMQVDRAEVCTRMPDGSFAALPFVLEPPQYETEVPEGFAPFGEAAFHGKLPVYADILRRFLNATAPAPGEKPLLSSGMWKRA